MAAGILIAASITGCQDPFADSDYTTTANLERLRRIQPVELDKYVKPAEADDRETDAAQDATPLPDELSIDLAQCRQWALESNLALKVQKVNPVIAAERVAESEARFESTLFGGVNYSERQSPSSTQLEGTETKNTSGNLGVRVPLRTGGTVTVDFLGRRGETDNQFSLLNPAYNADLSLSVSHNLLRNAGTCVNTAPIEIAALDEQRVNAQTRLEIIRVLAAVDREYWRLAATRQLLIVRQAQHELAKAQLERAENLVKQGVAAEVEIIRAQAGVAQGLEAIIVANNAVLQRQRELKRLLNQPQLPVDSKTTLLPVTDLNPIEYRFDTSDLLGDALTQRMELLEIELQMAQDAINVGVRRNATLPLAAFEYRYGRGGLDSGFGSALDQIFDENFDSHTVGLRVEVPLGNEQAKRALNQALLTRIQRSATKELRTKQIKQEVLDAVDNLSAAWQRVLASRQTAVLEARVLAAEERQFEQGVRTSTDVLDAQTRLADAQSSEVRALADYQISQIDLAYATGTVLGSAQVLWSQEGL